MTTATIPLPAGWVGRETSTTGPAVIDIRHVAIAHCQACGTDYEVGIRDHDLPDGLDHGDEIARVSVDVHAWTKTHADTCTGPTAA